jgi:hypothetical protein
MIAVCPNNKKHKQFITTAHEMHEWVVDSSGEFIRDIKCLEVTHGPDELNTFACKTCGAEAGIYHPNFLVGYKVKFNEASKEDILHDLIEDEMNRSEAENLVEKTFVVKSISFEDDDIFYVLQYGGKKKFPFEVAEEYIEGV